MKTVLAFIDKKPGVKRQIDFQTGGVGQFVELLEETFNIHSINKETLCYFDNQLQEYVLFDDITVVYNAETIKFQIDTIGENQKEKEIIKYCTIHPSEKLNLFCENHFEICCSFCLLFGEHKLCKPLPISESIPVCDTIFNAINSPIVAGIRRSISEELKENIESVKTVQKLFNERINEECDTLIEFISSKKQELIQTFSEQVEKQMQIFENGKNHLKEIERTIERLKDIEKRGEDQKGFEFICSMSKLVQLLSKAITHDPNSRIMNSVNFPNPNFSFSSVNRSTVSEMAAKANIFEAEFAGGPVTEVKVLLVGLDSTGKTTLLNKLKASEYILPSPTIGFNVESVNYKNIRMTIWDVGGGEKIRHFWKNYTEDISAIFFVVDSSDRDRILVARRELENLFDHCSEKIPLLIFANKSDRLSSMNVSEIWTRFSLESVTNREWFIQASNFISGVGIYEGLEWFYEHITHSKGNDFIPAKWDNAHLV